MKREAIEKLEKKYDYLKYRLSLEENKYDEEFDIRSYCRASGTLAGFKQCLNVLGYDIKNDKVVKMEENKRNNF